MIKLTKRSDIVIIGGVLLALGCYAILKVNIQQVHDLAALKIPNSIQQKYSQEILNDAVALVQINNRNIVYYYPEENKLRLQIILKALKKISYFKPGRIPNGTYFINMSDGIKQSSLLPVLASASNKKYVQENLVFLLPDIEAIQGYKVLFGHVAHHVPKFSWDRKSSKIFWRGACTGADKSTHHIDDYPRGKFLKLSRNLDFVDAAFTSYTDQLNSDFLLQLQQEFPLQTRISPASSLAYKYLVDIDGNSCSYSRMAWILYSNSLLMKHSSDNIQWYYAKLQPYVHYVPINSDFSDLAQQFAWAESHQTEVQDIINNANQLVADVFSEGAIQEAIIQAFIAYHKMYT